MIYLVTGLPGNGKTLYTVAKAPELLEHPGRTIYYHGIKSLTLPWEPCEPETWYNLPVGSAVVIDEAQQFFRPLPAGQQRPRLITELETHRHKGMDLWLITQHPNLLDSHVRRLVGKHIHVHRPFGLGATQVWAWEKVVDPDDYHAKKEAVLTRMRFKRVDFAKYKSAEVHTVKRRLPVKLFLLPVCLALIAGLAYLAYTQLKGTTEVPKAEQTTKTAPAVPGELKPAATPAVQRLQSIQPVIPELPHTAPRYERLTAAVAVPVVKACMANFGEGRIDCWCVSQRGTRIDTSIRFCLDFIQHGRPFYDFEPDSDRAATTGHVPPGQTVTPPETTKAPTSLEPPKLPAPLLAG